MHPLEGLPDFAQVLAWIERAAASEATILIQGETGAGKELTAQRIHERSPRGKGPFVAVNCGAIPEDLFESTLFGHTKGAFTGAESSRLGRFREAEGGTLFLDEVAEIPLSSQAKLLRALQEKEVEPVGGRAVPVDVRVVAATHRHLDQEVAKGRFREDLFYRLAVLELEIPSLSERPRDFPLLVDRILAELCRTPERAPPKLSPRALEFLAGCRFPGNIRELRNLLEGMLVWQPGPLLDLEDIPRTFRKRSFFADFRPKKSAPQASPAQPSNLSPEGQAPDPTPDPASSLEAAPLAPAPKLPSPEPVVAVPVEAKVEEEAEPNPPGPAEVWIPEGVPLKDLVATFEKRCLEVALERAQGVKKDAAKALGITPRAFTHYVHKHQLD